MSPDLVVRNGTVIDGSGRPRFRANVAIQDGIIVEIGEVSARGRREIDAEGHIVCPGFIDAHTHFDAQMNWDPLATSSCWHGVTSVIMGNCGFTLAPVRTAQRGLVLSNLERAEDMPASVLAKGVPWGWETFPEYLQAMERVPKGVNYAVYVGHSALRTWTMGERAFEGKADEDDLRSMCSQLEAALSAGAIGFSTSRSEGHETMDDRPVASRLASWDEVRTLVGLMGRMGVGVLELANEFSTRSLNAEVRRRSLRPLLDLAVETKVPMSFGVTRFAVAERSDTSFVATTPREVWRDLLGVLDAAARAGGSVLGQTNCRDINVLLSFRTQLPFDKLPVWRELRARPHAEQAQLIREPALRSRLVDAALNGPYGRAIGNEARKPIWDLMYVYDKPLPPYATVGELARQKGMDPVSLMIDLGLQSDFNCLFMQYATAPDEEGTLETMLHPHTAMTFSDAGAHSGQISDASAQSYLLAYWVRQRELLSLEDAIRMMTSRIAGHWRLRDRGLIGVGMTADINVLDPVRITPLLPEVAYDLPGGVRRLVQRSAGIKSTIVGGQVLFENGVHTGALPGRLLKNHKAPTA